MPGNKCWLVATFQLTLHEMEVPIELAGSYTHQQWQKVMALPVKLTVPPGKLERRKRIFLQFPRDSFCILQDMLNYIYI